MAEGPITGLGLAAIAPFDPISEPTSLGQRWKAAFRDIRNGFEHYRREKKESTITLSGGRSNALHLRYFVRNGR